MNIRSPARAALWPLTLAASSLCAPLALAQTSDPAAQIREELRALREEQARIVELQQRNEAAIRALEARIGVVPPESAVAATASANTQAETPAPPAADSAPARLSVSGDLRLRAQHDRSDEDARDRSSGQIRARLGATYAVNEHVSLGARLVTGDSDDPNSTDVQLSNWDDDLQVSLDMAYAQLNLGNLKLYGGKFPQPFARTDLVWDGDVNPQGLGATYKRALGNGGALRGNALFFLIDEIFQGTNNRERLIGSEGYLRALAGGRGAGVISTHDLELVMLAEELPQLKNYHFEETVHDGRMAFDYKLRAGPSSTTNALTIMRLEGLPVDRPAGMD